MLIFAVLCCDSFDRVCAAGMALSKAGFMIVGDSVRVGQRVRFMVSHLMSHPTPQSGCSLYCRARQVLLCMQGECHVSDVPRLELNERTALHFLKHPL